MNITQLIAQKTKSSSLGSDIMIEANEIKRLGIDYYSLKDYKKGDVLIIDGLELSQDKIVTLENKEYLVWAVLGDKIILKLISQPL